MRKGWIAVGALALCLATSASASGDYSCVQDWKLGGPGGHDCGDRPLLWPGNDSRSNLFMLLRGGQGLAIKPKAYPDTTWEDRSLGRTFYNWYGLGATFGLGQRDYEGGGSRCDSRESGARAFNAALGANTALPAADRQALSAARAAIGASCGAEASTIVWPTVKSAEGRDFLAYLMGADSFYAGDWASARQHFTSLGRARDTWVAETASYMLIRVDLNAAQDAAFDDYGDFKGAKATDSIALSRAGMAINAYLARFAKGRYAASATGLRRRVAWLAGDMASLGRAYETALANQPLDGAGAADLIQEIDNKLLWERDALGAVQSPLLLAAMDLARMRSDPDEGGKPLSTAELAAQKPVFAKHPDLYTYLAAARALAVDGDARTVLTLVPANPAMKGMSPLAYSAQALRGMALAQLKDPAEEAHWKALIVAANAPYTQEFAQFGLALLWQRSGRMAQVFAKGSPVVDPSIRQILLTRLAGPDLLRAAIADTSNSARTRDLALFTLLHKDLAKGHFADFARDRALVPADAPTEGYPSWVASGEMIPTGLFTQGKWQDGYACPAIDATARMLAQQPLDPQARLCLGEFWRLNGFDHVNDLEPIGAVDTLGGGKGSFTGANINRAALYKAVLDNARAAADDRAYALYRSVMCYAPSGNNDCGGTDVEAAQRKAWYFELKQRYPTSRWAKALRYYW